MAASGRVLQVNVSPGGVPKLPVNAAWVGRLGLEGDGHHERTQHGGPHRAVCLFAVEAIERLQADGHPVAAGDVGENLTTTGVEWSLLPLGTRARVGASIVLELASPAVPCATQRRNFRDGRFSRISIDLHPSDARMYARVLAGGMVRPGDDIELLPPAPDSRATDELLLERLDRAAAKSAIAGWRQAAAAGLAITIVDDGELAMAAAPSSPGARYNQALGLARMPHLVGEAQRFFEERATTGWIAAEPTPWPAAEADPLLGVFAAAPMDVVGVVPPDGVQIRVDRRAGSAHATRVVAEERGAEVGEAFLYVHHRTGWLRGAFVAPPARGRGIQRALITARARTAAEQGCDLVGSWAEPGSVSAANMLATGFRQLGVRGQYPYAPRTAGAAAGGISIGTADPA